MKGFGIISDSLISPLGRTSEENFKALKDGMTGVSLIKDGLLSESNFVGAKINSLKTEDSLTRFELISVLSTRDAIQKASTDIDLAKSVFILATTKGNIELLGGESVSQAELDLHATARRIATRCGIANSYVVSNACTSGVMALITAKRILKTGKFDHAIITGTDVLSRFVVSGFQSLHALSTEPCRPFDAARSGLNLGEGSATVILSRSIDSEFMLLGDGSTNDANHISGPSRTGEELAQAITLAVNESGIRKNEVDFISAHGTATLYNDEMEANAFAKAELTQTPVNSLKGYFGHTLGAAGLVEIIMSIHSLRNNELIPTKGFSKIGVSHPLNVISKNESRSLRTFLKTASGFGGCNAAIVIQKTN